jgi:phospholipid transport system substrate-binding protein
LKSFCLIILAMFAISSASAMDDQSGASARIEAFHTGLVDALQQSADKDFETRTTALCPLLRDAMDILRQGAASVGSRHWNQWTEEQRATYSESFEAYLCAIYADRFKSYSGEEFVVMGERAGPRGAMVVATEVRVAKSRPIPIDYVLVNSATGWRITDLFLDGVVSEVALRRAEFSSVLRDKGFDALIASVAEKIALWAVPDS